VKHKIKRQRLPKIPPLLLDPKIVNLLVYVAMLLRESAKPEARKWTQLQKYSVWSEEREALNLAGERLQALFAAQYPEEHYVYPAIRKQSNL